MHLGLFKMAARLEYTKERCKFMFNDEILSDVKFVVQTSRHSGNGESESKRRKIEIPAHKFLLSICSPVFFAMFCGEMAETKEHIDLPDCEYEGIFELLRYIYTDEVCLNGNNVMQVMYLAQKYMIPRLSIECTEYLKENLSLSNVFCIFNHAQQYENQELLLHCWDLIDEETEDVVKSSEFQSMERSFLIKLVKRNSLSIREVELFKAVDCWTKEECKRQKLKVKGSVKRQVLGEQIVKNIRFPIMKQNEFKDVVRKSKILTAEETSNITKYFRSTLTSPVGFLDFHRMDSVLRCCRFKGFFPRGNVKNDPDDEDFFPLTVDKDIMLHGVSLLGNDGGKFQVTLKILHYDDEENESVVASKTGTFTSERRPCDDEFYYGFDVLFDDPFPVEKHVTYYIQASVDGPGYCIGKEPLDEGHTSGVGFEFRHLFSQCSLFAELLFRVKK